MEPFDLSRVGNSGAELELLPTTEYACLMEPLTMMMPFGPGIFSLR
jgi:hypothetical protein